MRSPKKYLKSYFVRTVGIKEYIAIKYFIRETLFYFSDKSAA